MNKNHKELENSTLTNKHSTELNDGDLELFEEKLMLKFIESYIIEEQKE